jgi:hypothetical protein
VPPGLVGAYLHTDFVTHETLNAVLAAQQVNATLSGRDLRDAAENLLRLSSGRTVLKAVDAAGERIIGAALLLSESVQTWDYSGPFPSKSTCLLVGGVVAGPVGLAAAAQAAQAAGATRVDAAIVSGWAGLVPGVSRIREIGNTRMQVA